MDNSLTDLLKTICTDGAVEAGAEVRPTLLQQLERINIRHSQNGDPINHYLESIAFKLNYALQDRTVLAEISDAEIEVLCAEINAVKKANKEKTDDRPF